MDTDVLLTDEIYGRTIPQNIEGQLFHYVIMGYDSLSNLFKVQCQNKMIEEEEVVWEHHNGDHESMDGVSVKTIEADIKLYSAKFSNTRTHELNNMVVAEAVQKKEGEDERDEGFETEDLDEAADSSAKG